MARMAALVVLAATVLTAGCGKAQPEVAPRPTATPTLEAGSPAGERELTDMTGRAVSLGTAVERVVALSPSAVDFVVALGIRPMGRPSDSSNAAAAGAQVIGSTIAPDFKAIAELRPDIVVADATYHGARMRDFDRFPFPVFVIKVNGYESVLTAFTALGEALGRQPEAQSAAADLEAKAAQITGRIGGVSPPRVLLLTGSGREVYAASEETYAGSLLKLLRATNVLGANPEGAPLPGFGLVELAEAASLDPGVVLTISSGEGGLAAQVVASAAWAGTAAVAAGRVHELDPVLFLRSPGPRAAEALEVLAGLLYPGR
ncbi:MAG: ABC transporter substrate-binding protein [Thermoflexaceae bacterium]|nr:ABC transporter substrate-binding protein [Thermoflexaceae bacterium]